MSYANSATATGFRIQFRRKSASTIEHPLEDGRSVFVGCGDSCGIQVKGEAVADIHCLIDVEGKDVFIQDWASDAGTKVNGTLIDDKTTIQVGDAIEIGSLTFYLAGSPTPKQPPAERDQQEPREESVGMEMLGYDEQDQPVVSQHTATSNPTANRLSDSFSKSSNDEKHSDGLEASAEPTEDDYESVQKLIEKLAEIDDADEMDDVTHADAHGEIDAHDNVDEVAQIDAHADIDDDQEDDATALLHDEDNDLLDQEIEPNRLTAEDLDWDPTTFDDDQVDAEIVQLLKSEIEDLRIQLAERDEQLAAAEGLSDPDESAAASLALSESSKEFADNDLVGRVDDLLSELNEHDERVAMMQELLQTAEVQNQAEREERNGLETWVAEIEQRIGQRETEWQAERDALRSRVELITEERDRFQQKLHAAAKRFGKSAVEGDVPDETLKKLQQENAGLQDSLAEAEKQVNNLNRQIERLQTEEDPESLQAERAEVAREKAAVSRLRFQLSKQLQDIDRAPESKENPDREFAYKLQTLREHLREIHEEEKVEREQKGESLLGRISSLWKRVDDEY